MYITNCSEQVNKMRFGVFASLITLLLICSSASAFVTSFDGQARIGESPYELSFFVENTDSIKRPLFITYNFPVDYNVVNQPSFVEANTKEKIVVKLIPNAEVAGAEYLSTVSIVLGSNKAEKNIRLSFFNQDNCTINSSIYTTKGLEFSFENTSFKPKQIKLTEIKGVPADWKINGSTLFVLNGFESRTYSVDLVKNSSFSGIAEFVFSCENTSFSKKVEFAHENNGSFTGFANLGVIVSVFDSELILILFLVIIASIFLLAFIARLVRILNNGVEK